MDHNGGSDGRERGQLVLAQQAARQVALKAESA